MISDMHLFASSTDMASGVAASLEGFENISY